jgi:Leucine rich repeat/Leucine Rich Repeat
MIDNRCYVVFALFGVVFPVLFVLPTTSNDVRDALSTNCPSTCSCVPFSECDWCATNSHTTTDTRSVTSSSSVVSDDVSCEGCGEASDTGTSKTIRRRSMTSSSQHPVADQSEIIVSCVDAGLIIVPFQLPSLMSTLDLSGNHLRQLDPGFLEFAPTDVDISVSSWQVSGNGSHFNGPRIINLRLRNNRINWVAPGSFRGPSAASIRVLDIGDNRITGIDSGVLVGPITESLEQLDLSGNFIRELSDESFLSLRKLVRLDLRDNLLTELGPGVFRGLLSLRQLVLASNSIQSIDRRTFKPLESLVYIVLKGNPLGEQAIRFQVSTTKYHDAYI